MKELESYTYGEHQSEVKNKKHSNFQQTLIMSGSCYTFLFFMKELELYTYGEHQLEVKNIKEYQLPLMISVHSMKEYASSSWSAQ